MLVLTRKLNEEIIIDGQITIRLLRVNGNRIRLGIETPADVLVKRAEIWNDAASGPDRDNRGPAKNAACIEAA